MEGVVLALDASVFNQVAGIGLQSRHGTADVLVNFDNLLDGRRFKEGGCDALLDTEDDTFGCCYLVECQKEDAMTALSLVCRSNSSIRAARCNVRNPPRKL